jgi:putative ABC transport system ATP-binding protein
MMDTPSLSGRNLTCTFRSGGQTTWALDGVSLDLYPGEIALLHGPSGSGKTTLLGVLSGLVRPDHGQVVALGQDLWKDSDRRREQFRLKHCGFVFQGYNLFPELTARQQLEMVLCWGHGWTLEEARPKVADLLELLGLTRRADALPGQMSGGEKQRVALGRALIKDPALCFADEPTSALDWERGRQAVELMAQAAHDWGTTVLVVAHDPRIIPLVDRVYYLEDGRLVDPVEAEDNALRYVS